MSDKPTVAVLGTGIMGYPMAARLVDDGFDVRVWNRTKDKAQPLGERGATVADTPADAVPGADVVITMLASAAVVREVMDSAGGALAAMSPKAVWVQMSTVGVKDTRELQDRADTAEVPFIDAPVLGTKQPAEEGKLVVLSSGPVTAQERCDTVFVPLASKVMRVGAAGDGTRLKLVANNWVLALVDASAECVALARHLSVDPQLFLDAIEGTSVDSAYTHLKGKAMIQQDFTASFPARLAVKDASLVLDAASPDLDLRGARAVYEQMERTQELGHGNEDMAAVYHAAVQGRPGS